MPTMNTISTTPPAAPGTVTLPKRGLLVGGAIGLLAIGALAGALVAQRAPAAAETTVAVPATPPQAARLAQAPVGSRSARSTPNPANGTQATPLDTEPTALAAACASCGVVDTVERVVQKGQGTGLGAVAGGVLGGVVGSQMGKGKGRSAMTVLGAVGGGLAGNEIEKRQRSTTSYRVKVRMEDGTLRTFTRAEPLPLGANVTVEGNALHLRREAAAAAPAARPLKTASPGLQS
jgi:outer membrane lipoprotein SlyB